jgi:cytochrome c oxidase subunit 2
MLLGLGTAQADYTLNLMKGVTKVSNDIYDLHMLILWICVFIGLGVFGVMFYSIYHHRKSKGHQAAQFHENTTIEIIWTIIPTLILIAMAIPSTKTLLELDEVQDADMSIKVTGYQWFWEYEYLDEDKDPNNNLRFFSKLDEESNKVRQVGSGLSPNNVSNYLLNVDKPLVIPVKKKIRFLFTSKDVIHSWWVPDFGWKKDANPGFINDAWTYVNKPGIYRGQCTELCGKDHGFMPVVVIAKEQADYDKWVKEQSDLAKASSSDKDWPKDELMAEGAKVYEKNCASCHMADGKGIPGTFPAMTGSKIVTGDLNDQVQIMISGKGMMPAFGKNKMLNAAELAQVITYTRNALGNKVGDEIQPKAMEEALGGKSVADKSEQKSEKAEEKTGKETEKKTGKKKAATKKAEKQAEMTLADLVEQGKSVYEKNCSSCHMPDGKGLPGTFPALKGSSIVTGEIKDQVELMMSGKGMMPAFGSMLNAEEFAAVVTYTRNELGNSVGDLIQPSAVKSLQSAKK